MTKPYTRAELTEALSQVCPYDARRVLLHLDAARIDKRQQDALARMHKSATEMTKKTGVEWMAAQEMFTKAMADSEQAERDAEALYATQGKATP